MSDYKRWISYIYYYENNMKKNNIGYIRVESRGGNTKLTTHINVLSVTEPMNVYLFVRKGDKIRGINIGVISMDKGVGHGVYNTETDNIMGTGNCISDIGGVILFHKKDKFYASEWDDSVIDIEQFEEYDKNHSIENEDSESENITVHQNNNMNEAEEDEKKQRERTYELEEGLENNRKENERNEVSEKEDADNGIIDNNNIETPNIETANADGASPDIVSIQNTDTNESGMDSQVESDSGRNTIEAMENGKDGNNMAQEMRNAGNTGRLSDEIVMAAENILHTYPYMYPFENDDIDACVRIEPQDLSNLPIDTWLISNNSFLLKGYYGYRHLIFIKMGKVNPRYMIGVPGINHNRENFLANMFGFKLFKPIKNTSDIRGEFGYWCISISGK